MKIVAEDDCWMYAGQLSASGYGIVAVYHDNRSTSARAHRAMYETLVGEVPEGLELDHLCRNKACINSAHLEPVTHRENVLRSVGAPGINAAKTHCSNGHEFTEDNIYRFKRAPNTRICRMCVSISQKQKGKNYVSK